MKICSECTFGMICNKVDLIRVESENKRYWQTKRDSHGADFERVKQKRKLPPISGQMGGEMELLKDEFYTEGIELCPGDLKSN
jgi:hypothetical protein